MALCICADLQTDDGYIPTMSRVTAVVRTWIYLSPPLPFDGTLGSFSHTPSLEQQHGALWASFLAPTGSET